MTDWIWDSVGPLYAREADDLRQRFLHPVVVRMAVEGAGADRAFLDYGCGPGDVAEAVAVRYGRVVVLDTSPAMLEAARRRLGPRAAVIGPGDLDVATDRFDTVVLSLVLTTIERDPEARAVLSRVARHLAPGGRLLLATTHPCFTFRALAQVPYLESGTPYRVPIGEKIEIVEYHRPLGAVLALLGDAGFRIVRCEEIPDSEEYYRARGETPHRFAGRLPVFLVLECDLPGRGGDT